MVSPVSFVLWKEIAEAQLRYTARYYANETEVSEKRAKGNQKLFRFLFLFFYFGLGNAQSYEYENLTSG